MANIRSLARDIYDLFSGKEKPKFDDKALDELGRAIASQVRKRIEENYEEPKPPTLRMSNLGVKCKRRLWYLINTPNDAEPLPAASKIKFLFGDILEELMLFLATLAGHEVRGRQDELSIAGILGHRDAVIDNVLVDVKSASSFSFEAFQAGLRPETDKFGYLSQLSAYHSSSNDVDRNSAAFLVVDKTLGKVHVDVHKMEPKDWETEIEDTRNILSDPNPPVRGYTDVPDGKSGNRKLGTECSYCEFKHMCWPNLRTYYYASGPRYLTQVMKEPRVDAEA